MYDERLVASSEGLVEGLTLRYFVVYSHAHLSSGLAGKKTL